MGFDMTVNNNARISGHYRLIPMRVVNSLNSDHKFTAVRLGIRKCISNQAATYAQAQMVNSIL